MIKNVIFDIGNVLIRFDMYGEMLKAFGTKEEAERMYPIIFSKKVSQIVKKYVNKKFLLAYFFIY